MKSKIIDLKSKLANGVSPAMATPLLDDGYRVNTAVIPHLVDFLLEKGSKSLFVGGTTGEGILLSTKERLRLHEAAVAAVNGRSPILLHVGANRLDTAVTLTQQAVELGVDGIAAVTPFYYGLDNDALITYYRAISDAAPATPLLLYDIPHMAVNGISPNGLPKIATAVPTLAGIKTSHQNANIVRQLIANAPEPFIILAGNEAIALATLAMGVDGMISGLSTAVPEPFVALTQAMGNGELAAGQRWHNCVMELLACIPKSARIGAIKQIISERGIRMGTAVPPRPMPKEAIWPAMQAILQTYELL
ncbi:MAG: dihydrodipicolinate synthase family protein [Chloroflexi bacterium]|nr:dihydrodipicolinate synthase family protein [Chloroflexota bacterium]